MSADFYQSGPTIPVQRDPETGAPIDPFTGEVMVEVDRTDTHVIYQSPTVRALTEVVERALASIVQRKLEGT